MADDVDLLQENENVIEVDEGPALPTGVHNLITRAGFKAFETELNNLLQVERPGILKLVEAGARDTERAGGAEHVLAQHRLHKIDGRIRFIAKRMDSFKVVDPDTQRKAAADKVYFGATVQYDDEDGKRHQVTLVGVDEVDTSKGMISWLSPIGRALMGAHVDDEVEVRAPRGSRSLNVVNIAY